MKFRWNSETTVEMIDATPPSLLGSIQKFQFFEEIECFTALACSPMLFFFFLFWESNDFFKSFLSIVSTTTTKETNDDEDEDTIELARERILGNEFIALICKDQSRDRFEQSRESSRLFFFFGRGERHETRRTPVPPLFTNFFTE